MRDVAPAETVLGKYRIVREIGRSNNVVYEGVDIAMSRRVAIKELTLAGNLAEPDREAHVQRFYREARSAGTLSHPNIVIIHDVGEDDGRHFIAMEYLDGPTLRDALKSRGAFPLKESLAIALQLCDALGYAHKRGIIHRDVKPDNIYLIERSRVKLADFGIAYVVAEPGLTAEGQIFGTASYMSPEQLASQPLDARSDVFALGVVLCEMLTAARPFQGDNHFVVSYNILNTDPIIPADISPALRALLLRALAKDPAQRYQSMELFAQDIRGLASPKSVLPAALSAAQFPRPQSTPDRDYPREDSRQSQLIPLDEEVSMPQMPMLSHGLDEPSTYYPRGNYALRQDANGSTNSHLPAPRYYVTPMPQAELNTPKRLRSNSPAKGGNRVLVASLFFVVLLAGAGFWMDRMRQSASAATRIDPSVYTDSLGQGWQNWSWAKVNLANTSPVHSGAYSVAVSAGDWQGFSAHHEPMSTDAYKSISFWIYGTAPGGTKIKMAGSLNKVAQMSHAVIFIAPQGKWKHFNVGLSTLGVADKANFTGFWIQEGTGHGGRYYLDDISLKSR